MLANMKYEFNSHECFLTLIGQGGSTFFIHPFLALKQHSEPRPIMTMWCIVFCSFSGQWYTLVCLKKSNFWAQKVILYNIMRDIYITVWLFGLKSCSFWGKPTHMTMLYSASFVVQWYTLVCLKKSNFWAQKVILYNIKRDIYNIVWLFGLKSCYFQGTTKCNTM